MSDDIYASIGLVKEEISRSLGTMAGDPGEEKFLGMVVGDRISFNDHFCEAKYPNTLTKRRELTGIIVHLHKGRWGWGVRVKLDTALPEDDPLKVGAVVFRWGDSMQYWGAKKAT